MNETLTVIGGTYYEICIDPDSEELYGSAMRGAAALSGRDFSVELISCLAKSDLPTANSICTTFNIQPKFHYIEETVSFYYFHPLSSPEAQGSTLGCTRVKLPDHTSKNILFYGMIEADITVHGEYVVYDPQNHIPFTETGSTARHLALVLNKKEACLISGMDEDVSLEAIGQSLLESQGAEVVVIKNGSNGALVIDKTESSKVPVFKTQFVWPIGSGDIFSAVFAWQWALNHISPPEAAMIASKFTATYCQSKLLPLPESPENLPAIPIRQDVKKIYLGGPFFTICQKWLVNEFWSSLIDFGNNVFSPLHDIGVVQMRDIKSQSVEIVQKKLLAIRQADVILGIFCDYNPEIFFELGYAIAIGKEVIVFAERIPESHLLMLYGTKCKIVSDFSTAVYMASW